LLDQAALYADSAVTTSGLDDARARLAGGWLFPQILGLRFMDLPGAGDDAPGMLMRVAGVRIIRSGVLQYCRSRFLRMPALQSVYVRRQFANAFAR